MKPIEAVVLRSMDYKDSSKILYLYTPTGKMNVIARGVKKLNNVARHLSQNATLIQFEAKPGELPTMQEGKLLDDFANIKQDLERYTFVTHILELINHVIDEHNDHTKMYSFLVRLLRMFNNEIDPELLTFIFELKLLHFLGYGINFKSCNICAKQEDLVYHVSDGGLICRSHLKQNQECYEADIYLILKDLYYMDINQYNTIELSKNHRVMIRHIIDMTYEEFIGFTSKSREILKQIIKY